MHSAPLPAHRRPYRGTDPRDGKPVLFVPLAHNGEVARIFEEDYQLLADSGISSRWYLSRNSATSAYVSAWARGAGNRVTVARVMTEVGSGRKVAYRDGDPTNLRRDNMRIEEGYARRNDAALAQSGGTTDDAQPEVACAMSEIERGKRPRAAPQSTNPLHIS